MSTPNYWGFRINWRNDKAFEFLSKEIKEGRLRQGWGSDESQDLRKNPKDKGARANMPILRKVRKGDYLLIPHVPSYPYVTIVRAAEDFNKGYKFQIDAELKDYGHIFPIEKQSWEFARNNEHVDAAIRTSLRTPMRFWNIGNEDVIQSLLEKDPTELKSFSQNEQRAVDLLEEAIESTLQEDQLKSKIGELFHNSFRASEWEFALRKALELLLPHCYVKRVGGKQEKDHGCDLAVFIPSIERDLKYVIGIQIKDYKGIVRQNVLEQIKKADNYWTEDKGNGCILIDKYLIIIDSTKDKNVELEVKAKYPKVRILYRDDVLDILSRAAKIQMANNNL